MARTKRSKRTVIEDALRGVLREARIAVDDCPVCRGVGLTTVQEPYCEPYREHCRCFDLRRAVETAERALKGTAAA